MPAIVNVILIPPVLALVLTAVALWILMRLQIGRYMLDHPNQRSLHAEPTPRLGGIGMALGVLAAWSYAGVAIEAWVTLGLVVLIIVSLLEDVRGVPVLLRLATHLFAALLAAIVLFQAAVDPWFILAAVIATAWMTNLYNFMDGSDGLAGGMAAIGFGSYGVVALSAGDLPFAAVNLSIAAAACGFLLSNFPPARVFMGDVGSIPLGYLAAVLDVSGWLRGDWPVWFGAVVFSPFIVDATLTLFKRLLRGARVWHAHREHYYQRLVQGGWGHRKTALAEYALMILCSGVAVAGIRLEQTPLVAALGAIVLLYAGLVVALERHFPPHA